MKGSFASLLCLEDSPPELAQLPSLSSDTSLRIVLETGKHPLPQVASFTSLDSLVLDDSVQFLPATDLLGWGSGSPSPASLLFPKIQPPALSVVHPYPPAIRQAKIARYKAKLKQRRAKVPLSRHFTGRSDVARTKTRVKGKFVRA